MLVISSCKVKAQIHFKKLITDELTPYNYILFEISNTMEVYTRKEVNLIRFSKGKLIMYTFIRGGNFNIDTTFAFNGSQQTFLAEYADKIRSNTLDNDENIIAGSWSTFNLKIDKTKHYLEKKGYYSFYDEIIKLK